MLFAGVCIKKSLLNVNGNFFAWWMNRDPLKFQPQTVTTFKHHQAHSFNKLKERNKRRYPRVFSGIQSYFYYVYFHI